MILTLDLDEELLAQAEHEIDKAYSREVVPSDAFTMGLVDESLLTKKGKLKAMRALRVRALRSRSFMVRFILSLALEYGYFDVADNPPTEIEEPKSLKQKLAEVQSEV